MAEEYDVPAFSVLRRRALLKRLERDAAAERSVRLRISIFAFGNWIQANVVLSPKKRNRIQFWIVTMNESGFQACLRRKLDDHPKIDYEQFEATERDIQFQVMTSKISAFDVIRYYVLNVLSMRPWRKAIYICEPISDEVADWHFKRSVRGDDEITFVTCGTFTVPTFFQRVFGR